MAMVALGLFRTGPSILSGPLFGIYFLGASAGSLLSIVPFHEHREAGWLHAALPIRRYGDYYFGVVAALMFRLVGPWMVTILIVAIALDPTAVGIGLVLHAATGSLLAIPAYAMIEDDPPFSRMFVPGDQKGRVVVYLFNMLGLIVLATLGILLRRYEPMGLAATPVLFVIGFLVWMRAIRRRLNRHPPDFLCAAASGSVGPT